MKPVLITHEDLHKLALSWSVDPELKQMSKVFEFKDFKAAIGFMNACTEIINDIDHHPDWSNTYNKVVVTLSTHSHNHLTNLDKLLAQAMDDFYLAQAQ